MCHCQRRRRHSNGDAECNACNDANSYSYIYTDGNGDAYGYFNPNFHTDCNSHFDSNAHRDTDRVYH